MAAPSSSSADLRGWATLGLAVVGALLGGLAFFRGAPTSGGGASADLGDLDARLAAHESRVRSAVADDLKRQVKAAEEAVVKAERRLEEARTTVQKSVDDGRRVAENAVRATTDQVETVETQVREVADKTGKLVHEFETLRATVKEIESRPIAVAPVVGPGPAPAAPAPGPTPAPSDPATPAMTPEEEAAHKARVAAAIEALSSTDIAKVWTAAANLGRFGDLSATEPLVKLLKEHKDIFARTAAAGALGNLKACDAVPALLAALLDRDDGVTLAAAQAFGKIVGVDAGMTGSPTRKERNDAMNKWTKWWAQNEMAVRVRLNQVKGDAPK